tara:strand:+ start:184 stop:432 length:249 start_codon:yes stop_codon:yes gene_type:complete
MPQKVDFSDYDKILANFDDFCDEFENRATNAYMKGDQNDGRVVSEIERIGENTPMAVREVEPVRENPREASESIVDVQASNE